MHFPHWIAFYVLTLVSIDIYEPISSTSKIHRKNARANRIWQRNIIKLFFIFTKYYIFGIPFPLFNWINKKWLRWRNFVIHKKISNYFFGLNFFLLDSITHHFFVSSVAVLACQACQIEWWAKNNKSIIKKKSIALNWKQKKYGL